MENLSLLLIEVFFTWGHFIKPPYLSLGGASLPYPPPTTLIGALAYPYYKHKNLHGEILYIEGTPHSPAVELLNYIKYASIGYLEPTVSQIIDINKYYTFAYLREEYRKDESMWTSITGVGKTYVLSKAVALYLVKKEYAELLSKVAWGISRIGSKESLVAVTNVHLIKEPIALNKTTIETIFPTPAVIVKNADKADKIVFWKITPEAYSRTKENLHEILEEYYIPKSIRGLYGAAMHIEVDRDKTVVYETPYTPVAIPISIVKASQGELK